MVLPSCNKVDLEGMGPKDKIVCHRSPHRRSIRTLIFSYYFPYLYGLLRPKNAEKERRSRNVLSFEYQLRKQPLEHPTFLAYLILFTFLTIVNTLSNNARQ